MPGGSLILWSLGLGTAPAPPLHGIVAHLYRGDDAGGPIDWSAPVATITGTTYEVADLAPGQVRTYGLRLYDADAGLEESGIDAVVRLARDAAGRDVSRLPAGPSGLVATPRAGGSVDLTWLYLGRPDRPDPAEFALRVQAGTTVNPAADPDLVVAFDDITYTPDNMKYRARISGLTPGTAYAALVRGMTGPADDGNMALARFVASGLAPAPVERLVATATYRDMGNI